MPNGVRICTSNVDGQIQKARFDSDHVTECHGSIHHLQCMKQCGQDVWPADAFQPVVNANTSLLQSALPSCPSCGGLARPNTLMFGDWDFDGQRYGQCRSGLQARTSSPFVVEIGAGTGIPSASRFGESIDCPLIRINPIEWQVALKRDIGIALGAKTALIRMTGS